MVNSIDKYLGAKCKFKGDKEFQAIWKKIFDWLYDSIKKVNLQLDKINDNFSSYISNTSKILLGFINILSQAVITMCCLYTSDLQIWQQLKQLYKECINNKIMINSWQIGLEKITKSLIISLTNISTTDFEIMTELNPFKEFPMKKEYALQVLFNAFESTEPNYNKFKNTSLYLDTFEVWMRLLRVIDITEELSNRTSLLNILLSEYSISMICINAIVIYSLISKLINLGKIGKSVEYSAPSIHPPPCVTLFVNSKVYYRIYSVLLYFV